MRQRAYAGHPLPRRNSPKPLPFQRFANHSAPIQIRPGHLPTPCDDLGQIVVQELLKVGFDPGLPGGASERTFVIAVIDRQLTKVKRDRQRDKRRVNYESAPLAADEAFTEKAFFALAREDKHELKMDVRQALVGLTPAERAVCEALGLGHSQAEIARATGRSKAAVCGEVKRIRAKFLKWGLGDSGEQDPGGIS